VRALARGEDGLGVGDVDLAQLASQLCESCPDVHVGTVGATMIGSGGNRRMAAVAAAMPDEKITARPRSSVPIASSRAVHGRCPSRV